MRLKDKVAIVTGAGCGIGRAIAFVMAKEGANVVVSDRHIEPAEEVAEEIKALGGQAKVIIADIFNLEEVKQLVSKTLDNFKTIDILANNAGIGEVIPAEDLTEAEWDVPINVNLKGLFFLSQPVGRHMIAQKRGKIVNVASVSALRGTPGFAAYCASKGGVIALSKALAVEWGPYNINVNVVSPGMTETPQLMKIRDTSDILEGRMKRIPLRRMNKPEDIANAVLFFASAESDNITGQDISVDGGICALHSGYVWPDE